MFDSFGKPTGYDQIAPGRDQRRMTPLQGAIQPQQQTVSAPPGASNYPSDPSMQAWRSKAPGSSPKIQSQAALQGFLQGGMNPQQAVQQYNQQFNRTTGNEAVYYAPSVHGKATIGIPEGYFSQEPNGWQYTQRQPQQAATSRLSPLISAIQPNQQQQSDQPYYQTLLAQLMQQIQ